MTECLPVSVVTIAYRNAEPLRRCLRALADSSPPPAEVVVVDNASPDNALEVAQEFAAQSEKLGIRTLVVKTGANLGFGKGCAAGVAASSARFIFLLNGDAQVEPGTLRTLLDAADQVPQPAILQPLVVFSGERERINSTGVIATLDAVFEDDLFGRPLEDLGGTKMRDIAAATGTAELMRRQDIDRLGFFDPDFFMYAEDADLGLRWRRAGARAFLVPSARVYHEYRASSEEGSPELEVELIANSIEAAIKNYPPLEAAVAALLFSYHSARIALTEPRGRGRARAAALARALERSPRMIRKRRAVRRLGPDDLVRPWISKPSKRREAR